MLQYRQFMQSYRTNRITPQTLTNSHHTHTNKHSHHSPHSLNYKHSPHQTGSQHKSHNTIKQLLSYPNYGEIFYSDEGNRRANVVKSGKKAKGTRESTQNQNNTTVDLSRYLGQLEEENMFLKQRLNQSQRMGDSNIMQVQRNGRTSGLGNIADFDKQNRQKYYDQGQNIPKASRQEDPNILIQQSIQNQPNNYYRSHNNAHQYHNTNQYCQFNNLNNISNYKEEQQPRFRTQKYPANIFTLAQQKLDYLKDDDEKLRQYSLQVLRKPISRNY